MNRFVKHFRRHLDREPWDFCWRIGLESTVVCLIVGYLLAVFFDVPRRDFLDYPMSRAFLLVVVIAPPIETLIFQAFPIFVIRVCRGSNLFQIAVSSILFSAA
ncbi:MAG: hypothetical protein RBU25_15270, partial [Lentisphaeria bacterium]|nr:hypothetical protein [Lentisphaeria bacterium]